MSSVEDLKVFRASFRESREMVELRRRGVGGEPLETLRREGRLIGLFGEGKEGWCVEEGEITSSAICGCLLEGLCEGRVPVQDGRMGVKQVRT